jgi:hypothetical protein
MDEWLFTVALFRALFHAPFRPFLPFSSFFYSVFPPFSIRSAKKVENRKKQGPMLTLTDGSHRPETKAAAAKK